MRLVPKSMTLDDLERLKRTFFRKKSFYRAHQKNLKEVRPILSATKCRPMILVSRNKRFVQGFPRKGAPIDSGVLENGNVQTFLQNFQL